MSNDFWYYTRRGKPSGTLEHMTSTVPLPDANDLIIETKAVGLNLIDCKLAEFPGWVRRLQGVIPFGKPHIPCRDFAGVILQVGTGVSQWKAGDEIMGRLAGFDHKGSLQRFATIPASAPMIIKPADLSWSEAAGLPLVYTTVYDALVNRGRLPREASPSDRAKRSVLILGGTSGTGSTAVQLAKQMGLNIVTTCSGKNEDLVRSLGADEVIDYRTEDVAQRAIQSKYSPYAVVLDCVGGKDLLPYLGKLILDDPHAPELGVYVTIAGDAQGEAFTQPATLLHAMFSQTLREIRGRLGRFVPRYMRVRSWIGAPRYVFAFSEPKADVIKTLSSFLSGGGKLLIDSAFDFKDAKGAFSRVESGRAKGKVIIET